MKTVVKEILGFSVPVTGVVETIAEAVEAAGSEERVVELFNNYVLFHQHFGKLRTALVKKIEELTQVKREVDKEGAVNEDAKVYVARLEEEGVDFAPHLAALSDLVASLPVDYKVPVRGTGEGNRIAKKWLAIYDQIVEEGKLELYCSKNKISTEGISPDELKTVVAQKIKEKVTAANAAVLASALSIE